MPKNLQLIKTELSIAKLLRSAKRPTEDLIANVPEGPGIAETLGATRPSPLENLFAGPNRINPSPEIGPSVQGQSMTGLIKPMPQVMPGATDMLTQDFSNAINQQVPGAINPAVAQSVSNPATSGTEDIGAKIMALGNELDRIKSIGNLEDVLSSTKAGKKPIIPPEEIWRTGQLKDLRVGEGAMPLEIEGKPTGVKPGLDISSSDKDRLLAHIRSGLADMDEDPSKSFPFQFSTGTRAKARGLVKVPEGTGNFGEKREWFFGNLGGGSTLNPVEKKLLTDFADHSKASKTHIETLLPEKTKKVEFFDTLLNTTKIYKEHIQNDPDRMKLLKKAFPEAKFTVDEFYKQWIVRSINPKGWEKDVQKIVNERSSYVAKVTKVYKDKITSLNDELKKVTDDVERGNIKAKISLEKRILDDRIASYDDSHIDADSLKKLVFQVSRDAKVRETLSESKDYIKKLKAYGSIPWRANKPRFGQMQAEAGVKHPTLTPKEEEELYPMSHEEMINEIWRGGAEKRRAVGEADTRLARVNPKGSGPREGMIEGLEYPGYEQGAGQETLQRLLYGSTGGSKGRYEALREQGIEQSPERVFDALRSAGLNIEPGREGIAKLITAIKELKSRPTGRSFTEEGEAIPRRFTNIRNMMSAGEQQATGIDKFVDELYPTGVKPSARTRRGFEYSKSTREYLTKAEAEGRTKPREAFEPTSKPALTSIGPRKGSRGPIYADLKKTVIRRLSSEDTNNSILKKIETQERVMKGRRRPA